MILGATLFSLPAFFSNPLPFTNIPPIAGQVWIVWINGQVGGRHLLVPSSLWALPESHLFSIKEAKQ